MEESDVLELKKLKQLRKMMEAVETREDLAAFADALAAAYQDGVFEEQHITDYIGGIAGAALDLDGLYLFEKREFTEEPEWKKMAEILFVAFSHS